MAAAESERSAAVLAQDAPALSFTSPCQGELKQQLPLGSTELQSACSPVVHRKVSRSTAADWLRKSDREARAAKRSAIDGPQRIRRRTRPVKDQFRSNGRQLIRGVQLVGV